MDTVPLKPERLAQLEDLARRRGKSTADALDEALADYPSGSARIIKKLSLPSAKAARM